MQAFLDRLEENGVTSQKRGARANATKLSQILTFLMTSNPSSSMFIRVKILSWWLIFVPFGARAPLRLAK